jgi:SAM-dependent methyltransferase
MTHRLVNEIEHGRYLVEQGASEIWNWESPAGRLRWKRRVQMLTNHLISGTNVLELGCGTASFTRELALTGANITAIDISPELLEAARSNCPLANVTFELQNAYALSYPDARVRFSGRQFHIAPSRDRLSAAPNLSRTAIGRANVFHRAQHVESADCGAKERTVHQKAPGRFTR